jgi:transposase InsO family protein
MIVNHKRIARIMREDNLLVVRQDRPRNRGQALRAARVYLNLAARMTLLGPDQLWAADITYIRLAREFVYLAVVLDVFSRKVIGWSFGRNLGVNPKIETVLTGTLCREAPANGNPTSLATSERIQADGHRAFQQLRKHGSTCEGTGYPTAAAIQVEEKL